MHRLAGENQGNGSREMASPLYVEIADVKGEGHFTIPATVHSLLGDLVALKVSQLPEALVNEHLKGRAALVWLNPGGIRGIMEVSGQVRWLKDLGVSRSFIIGVELKEADPEVEAALQACCQGTPADTLDLWNRWEEAKNSRMAPETDYRDAYLIGLSLMFVGFTLPLLGLKLPVILSYASILLGGLGIGARGVWKIRQNKANAA